MGRLARATSERYIVVLHALLFESRILLDPRTRVLGAAWTVSGFSFPVGSGVSPAPVTIPSEQHDVLRHNLGDIPLHPSVVLVGARLDSPLDVQFRAFC